MLDLNKDLFYVLACSFGPDSMALFDMLIKEHYRFAVAHVNYHKRDVSNYEEESLRKICAQNDIKIMVLDTEGIEHKGNFQAWAREIRYDFFAKCIRENNADALLVAHHMDDLLETYIMQTSKNKLLDYYGIKSQTTINEVKVLRPLLSYEKKELYDYCLDNNVPFSLDVSNDSDMYTRNKIRHETINKLTKKEKLEVVKTVDFQNKQIEKKLKEISKHIVDKQIEIAYILSLRDIKDVQYAIDLLLKQNCIKKSASLFAVKELLKALNNEHPNIRIPITKNKFFIKDYKILKIGDNLEVNNYTYIVREPAIVDTEFFRVDLLNHYKDLRVSEDDFPLTIRNAQKGDMSYINNIPKKVSRLYIDWKMPKELRTVWPLIFNKKGQLVYVLRYHDEKSKNSNNFFVVKI